MPYSPKAHRLFEGIAHGSIPPKKGLTQAKAATLASEGIKKPAPSYSDQIMKAAKK